MREITARILTGDWILTKRDNKIEYDCISPKVSKSACSVDYLDTWRFSSLQFHWLSCHTRCSDTKIKTPKAITIVGAVGLLSPHFWFVGGWALPLFGHWKIYLKFTPFLCNRGKWTAIVTVKPFVNALPLTGPLRYAIRGGCNWMQTYVTLQSIDICADARFVSINDFINFHSWTAQLFK